MPTRGRPRKEGAVRNAKGRIIPNRQKTIEAALSVALAQRGGNLDGAALPGTAAIYIMRAVDRIKVGVSKNPAYRNDELKKETKQNLEIEWAARGREEDVRALELALHRLMRKSPFHIKGEWYSASVASVAELVLKLARQRGVELDRERMATAKREPPIMVADPRKGSSFAVVRR
jgi:hypothetical protein